MMRWRGAMLDISRHFFDKDFIKKTLSSLAIFDYNVLHLHLTDDQGWRLESKRFPELHLTGSTRKHSQNNHGLLEPTYDELPHSGFLTHEDIKELIKRAMREANPTYPVPIIWDEKEFRRVIELL